MRQINWCKNQKKGIKIVEPNDNLSEEFYESAEDSLNVLRNIKPTKSRMWLATTKYYIQYFAVYSVLMKLGIKCEIHDCTISLAKFLEDEGVLEKGTFEILEDAKQLRIDNQYYIKNKPVDVNFEKLSEFMVSIKQSLDNLDEDRIKEIRSKIREF